MKALKVIKKVLLVILGTVYFAFALFMTILLLNYNEYGVTQFGSKSLILINDSISSENFKKGDLVIVKEQKLEEIKVGDEIFTYRVDAKGRPNVELGTVGKIYPNENAISFENGSSYEMDFVAGKAIETHSKIGGFLSIVESQWGFLFIVLVPCFLIFIYEVYALIVEIKYGAEEE